MKRIGWIYRFFVVFLFVYSLAFFRVCANEILFYVIELVCTLLFTSIPKLKKSPTVYIVSVYYCIIGVLQPIGSLIHPENYIEFRITVDLLLNTKMRVHYFFYLTLSYIVMMLAALFFSVFLKKKEFSEIKMPPEHKMDKTRGESSLAPFLLATVFSILRFLFQKQFSILAPGRVPTIAYSGLFVFAIRILSLAVYGYCVHSLFKREKGFLALFVKGFVLILICGLPQALMGSRSEIVLLIFQFLFLLFEIYKGDRKKVEQFFLLSIALLALGAVSILLVNRIRTGASTTFIEFATIRTTGLADGLVVISYLNKGGLGLPISNFFLSSIGSNSGTALAYYYTHFIVNYPVELVHSYATPNFAGCLLYGGIPALLLFSFFEGLIMFAIEAKISSFVRRGEFYCSVCSIYFLTMLLVTALFEGNIDRVLQFAVVGFAAFLIGKLLKRPRRKSLILWNLKTN